MSDKTKTIKMTPLKGDDVTELIHNMELDIADVVETLCSNIPMSDSVMDMFDPDNWEVILYALSDIKSYVNKVNNEVSKHERKIKFKDRQFKSQQGGTQYWKKKYEDNTAHLTKSVEEWVIKYNNLLKERGGAA